MAEQPKHVDTALATYIALDSSTMVMLINITRLFQETAV